MGHATTMPFCDSKNATKGGENKFYVFPKKMLSRCFGLQEKHKKNFVLLFKTSFEAFF